MSHLQLIEWKRHQPHGDLCEADVARTVASSATAAKFDVRRRLAPLVLGLAQPWVGAQRNVMGAEGMGIHLPSLIFTAAGSHTRPFYSLFKCLSAHYSAHTCV